MWSSVPAWLPALFAVLLFIGYRHSLPRQVRPGTSALVAVAMMGFSLFGVIGAFGASAASLACWAAGYAATASSGARRAAAAGMATAGANVAVPGSWVPMGLILGIFTLKTVLGVAAGLHLALLGIGWFVVVASACLGALSGGFGARALAVNRFAFGARPA